MSRVARSTKSRHKTEFGDFQTPAELAELCCARIAETFPNPVSVVEPTCGTGAFLEAALTTFPTLRAAIGVEINDRYAASARSQLAGHSASIRIHQADVFSFDRQALVETSDAPLLVVGNPPWVTNSELGRLQSKNLPRKSNLHGHRGFDALTGKSNFDVSEWILSEFLRLLAGRRAVLGLLCKTSVARRALLHAWRSDLSVGRCRLFQIDSQFWFRAAVDACLCVCDLRQPSDLVCDVFESLDETEPSTRFGLCDDQLVANLDVYRQHRSLRGRGGLRWRSGIKHDCARVMELTPENGHFCNGLGDFVDVEPEYVFPLLKSSDLAAGNVEEARRRVVVPQRRVGDDTEALRHDAPRTWAYLKRHRGPLDRRRSSIYKNRPSFSIFGIGDYSFAPWKVAISGLYKSLEFRVVGSIDGQPVMLDDTTYFVPCETKEEAIVLCRTLNETLSREFLASLIFWDAKRPITADKLSQIEPAEVARRLGRDLDADLLADLQQPVVGRDQLSLFS